MNPTITQQVLLQLETPLNEITQRIIAQQKREYLEKIGKEMNITPWMERMIRLSLVIDLMKALQNYILPTDKLEGFVWNEGPKGIEIKMNISRDGDIENIQYLETEAIYAGGYNIQRLHLRYLTKTKMSRVNGQLATEYQNQYKKLSKIEKLEKEIENFQNRITEYQTRIDELTPMSKEELIVELGKHHMYAWRVNTTKWEDVDKEWYEGTKEEWEADNQKLIENGMISMIEWDVNRPKRYIKDYQKKIVKLQGKIESLTIS